MSKHQCALVGSGLAGLGSLDQTLGAERVIAVESRWGHQFDFSGGFPARILIPPCRDQNPCLAPRLVKDADDLPQLVLRDPRVHRRRLNIRCSSIPLA